MSPAPPPYLDAEAIRRAAPMAAAIDAVAAAFAAPGDVPARQHLEAPAGQLLVMPAATPAGTAVKAVTVRPGNPERGLPLVQGLLVLFDPDTLAPAAVLDAAPLTAVRTAATSALATRLLARPDAERLVLFGAGAQARAHLEAMLAVRPVAGVVVVGRDPDRARALAQAARELGLEARTGSPEAVGEADLVCTCTTSPRPVFDGRLLAPGTHVNAVGAFRASDRELDDAAVAGPGRRVVVVETRAAALAEAGDVAVPVGGGVLAADDLVELADVVAGRAGRRDGAEITIFKSVGTALEDVAVATLAAREHGAALRGDEPPEDRL